MKRFGPRTRKAILLVHILAAGGWLGVDVVMAVFVGVAATTDDPDTRMLSFRALDTFAVPSLLTTGTISLLSGLLLGLGSRYGLVRYWWVAVKLVLNLVLTALVLVGLAPAIQRSLELAAVGDLAYPPVVSPVCLLIAYTLAVFKPWGRIGKSRPTA
ncbi:hypothetical protein AB0M47_34480 [Hamadaea sp. NPDC051192]|uniref:hypothetical protein n=1 Tax=Hamadaea sp. NPDC051192 TaxID=3154940 RepID=UPI00343208EC